MKQRLSTIGKLVGIIAVTELLVYIVNFVSNSNNPVVLIGLIVGCTYLIQQAIYDCADQIVSVFREYDIKQQAQH